MNALAITGRDLVRALTPHIGAQATGKRAYEADVAARPTYHDGAPRPTWEQLSEIARWSWSRS